MYTRRHKCPCCRDLFLPHPCVWDRQRYCSKRGCQQVRKALNNAAYRRRFPDYDSGPDQVARTREWRREHPRYWQQEKRNGGPGRQGVASAVDSPDTLQAESMSEPVSRQSDPLRLTIAALQAEMTWQHLVFQGLAARLTGSALQADIAGTLECWYATGQRAGPDPLFLGQRPTPVCRGGAPAPLSECSSPTGQRQKGPETTDERSERSSPKTAATRPHCGDP